MKLPRVMIAAPKSGSGKTIITCGLLEALKRQGVDVRSYKCGPDYIDPMFHRNVIGVPGGNLDTFFSSDEEIRSMLASYDAEAAVVEGVMGIYDGITGLQGRGSCYEAAKASGTPVVLVIDVRGMGQTMLSVIKGLISDDREGLIRGVVLNRISARYYTELKPHIEEMLESISRERGVSVKLLGGLPDAKDIHLESRHLGLMMPGEIDDLKKQLAGAADLIEEHLDMDALREIMASAEELTDRADEDRIDADTGLTLAVARDEAFCFYYEENLRMFKDAGVRIIDFSPVHDSRLPDEADGLLLGGGYPELYAEQLSGNTSMLASVRQAVEGGMPSLAECGGFMYLLDTLRDSNGDEWHMAGVLSGGSHNTGKIDRFGYVTVSEKKHLCAADSLLTGLSIKGHEFHYFDSDNNGSNAVAVKPGSERKWDCMHVGCDHIWGFPHLWYPSCPHFVKRFIEAMRRYKGDK